MIVGNVLEDTVCNSMMSINTDVKWNDLCYCMNVEGKTRENALKTSRAYAVTIQF